MKSTTPALLSSTSCLRVVLVPSLVSIPPPKPSRVRTSPTATLEAPFVAGAAFVASVVDLGAGFAGALVFLVDGAGAGGAAGALRLRSSTGHDG